MQQNVVQKVDFYFHGNASECSNKKLRGQTKPILINMNVQHSFINSSSLAAWSLVDDFN